MFQAFEAILHALDLGLKEVVKFVEPLIHDIAELVDTAIATRDASAQEAISKHVTGKDDGDGCAISHGHRLGWTDDGMFLAFETLVHVIEALFQSLDFGFQKVVKIVGSGSI